MASAQDIYRSSEYPGQAPTMTASDAIWNWYNGSWDKKNQNYIADRNEWNINKNLQLALWERDDSYYQRLVNDMKKAGLNPYYALNNNLLSPQASSAESSFKSRRNKEDSKDKLDLKGFLVSALLIMKLLA